MSWYYIDGSGVTLGPVEESVIVGEWKKKTINADTYVWNGTTVNDWTVISGVSSLHNTCKNAVKPAKRVAAPKKKKMGGARGNLLDSIRAGKSLKKTDNKEKSDSSSPAVGGGATGGSSSRGKPKKAMTLQDQLAMKLKKRSTGGTGGGVVKKNNSRPAVSNNRTNNSRPAYGSNNQAKNKTTTNKTNSNATKNKSAGGNLKAPPKFKLKKAIDACEDVWVLLAIEKLLS